MCHLGSAYVEESPHCTDLSTECTSDVTTAALVSCNHDYSFSGSPEKKCTACQVLTSIGNEILKLNNEKKTA